MSNQWEFNVLLPYYLQMGNKVLPRTLQGVDRKDKLRLPSICPFNGVQLWLQRMKVQGRGNSSILLHWWRPKYITDTACLSLCFTVPLVGTHTKYQSTINKILWTCNMHLLHLLKLIYLVWKYIFAFQKNSSNSHSVHIPATHQCLTIGDRAKMLPKRSFNSVGRSA